MPQPAIAFSQTAQAVLAGHLVRARLGVKLGLAAGPLYLCMGDSFKDSSGQRWEGLGVLGELSGLQCGAEAVTSPLTMTLSGVISDDTTRKELFSTLKDAALSSTAELAGRTVSVYLLLFDATMGQPVDAPYVLQIYQIGNASLRYDGAAVTYTLSADPLFGGKHIPPLNLLSDADQQAKYPGDAALERMAWRKTVVTY
jgi:hypothetical protein